MELTPTARRAARGAPFAPSRRGARSAPALRACLALAALGVGPWPTPLAAQSTPWRIASMRMEAELDSADRSALVSMRWTLVAAEPGAALPLDVAIPVELLGFGDASVTEVEHEGVGRVVLWPTHGTHRAATLRPPFEGVRDSEGPAVPSLELGFSYRAVSVLEEDGGYVRVRIPVLTGPPLAGGEPGAVDVAALEAGGLGPTGFFASVSVPAGWRISDGFPTGLRRSEDGALRAALPVAPSMVGLAARADGGWSPGLPLVVDALALAVLLAFALRGWLHLRGVVAARRHVGARSAGPEAAP